MSESPVRRAQTLDRYYTLMERFYSNLIDEAQPKCSCGWPMSHSPECELVTYHNLFMETSCPEELKKKVYGC
jgi:hypothetical protein